jgi:signal transduction histidine kinase
VLAHRGTIRAQSELNHGSTFLFTLALATADKVPEEPANQKQSRRVM